MGEGFESGSFSVIDPEGKLFRVFDAYISFVRGARELKNGVFVSVTPFGSGFVYNRDPKKRASSHYKKGLSLRQFGIDMRFESNAYALPILPYQTTHLLVGRVKTMTGLEKTFIKYEPHGLGDVSSVMAHGVDFLNSSKMREKKRSEKDIIKPILKMVPSLQKGLVSLSNNHGPIEGLDAGRDESFGLSKSVALNIINDKKLKLAGKGYDVSSLALAAYLIWHRAYDEKTKEMGIQFLNTLESIYHDEKISEAGWSMESLLRRKPKVFYRSGNEVVVRLYDVGLHN